LGGGSRWRLREILEDMRVEQLVNPSTKLPFPESSSTNFPTIISSPIHPSSASSSSSDNEIKVSRKEIGGPKVSVHSNKPKLAISSSTLLNNNLHNCWRGEVILKVSPTQTFLTFMEPSHPANPYPFIRDEILGQNILNSSLSKVRLISFEQFLVFVHCR